VGDFWVAVAATADTWLLAKEVSDIIEVDIGIELGLKAKGELGPAKFELGVSAGDSLIVEGSHTRLVTEGSAGANVKFGSWSAGPSASIQRNRWTGKVTTSITPLSIGIDNGNSKGSATPMKARVGVTAVFIKAGIGVNLTEVKDLCNKIVD